MSCYRGGVRVAVGTLEMSFVISTLERRQSTHILEGFGSMTFPQIQQRLAVSGYRKRRLNNDLHVAGLDFFVFLRCWVKIRLAPHFEENRK